MDKAIAMLPSQIGPWGDQAIASYFGTFAQASGDMSASAVKQAMLAEPENLFKTNLSTSNQVPKLLSSVQGKKKVPRYCDTCTDKQAPFQISVTRQGDLVLSNSSPDYSQAFNFGDVGGVQLPGDFLSGLFGQQNPEGGVLGDKFTNDTGDGVLLASAPTGGSRLLCDAIKNACLQKCGDDDKCLSACLDANRYNENGCYTATTKDSGGLQGLIQTSLKYLALIAIGLLIAYAGFKSLSS